MESTPNCLSRILLIVTAFTYISNDDNGGCGGSGCNVDDDALDVDDDDDDDDGVFEWTILAAFNRHSFQTWPDPAIKKCWCSCPVPAPEPLGGKCWY